MFAGLLRDMQVLVCVTGSRGPTHPVKAHVSEGLTLTFHLFK